MARLDHRHPLLAALLLALLVVATPPTALAARSQQADADYAPRACALGEPCGTSGCADVGRDC